MWYNQEGYVESSKFEKLLINIFRYQAVGGYPHYEGYYPVSTPEPPLVTEEDIKLSLIKQIEYYFSDANLAKGAIRSALKRVLLWVKTTGFVKK